RSDLVEVAGRGQTRALHLRVSACKEGQGAALCKEHPEKDLRPQVCHEVLPRRKRASAGPRPNPGAAVPDPGHRPAAAEGAKAANLLRVAPGDPDHSFLMLKIEGHLGPNEGVPMPLVGGPLPASDIDTVRRWIAAGASDAPF